MRDVGRQRTVGAARIGQEKATVMQMIGLYCHGHGHSHDGLCADCQALAGYAFARLDRCRFGNRKPTCKKCPVHCYSPAMRQSMRRVMRYAGPRMLFCHPVAALRHFLREI